MPQIISLPDWASFRKDAKGNPLRNGVSLVIDVNAPEMYESTFDELRALYAERVPSEWLDADGKLKKEWADALEDLNSDTPSAYWCEAAHQMMKMELQVACRTLALNIHVNAVVKSHAQKNRPQKRDPKLAAGGGPGSKSGKEARQHFKNLHGFIPA